VSHTFQVLIKYFNIKHLWPERYNNSKATPQTVLSLQVQQLLKGACDRQQTAAIIHFPNFNLLLHLSQNTFWLKVWSYYSKGFLFLRYLLHNKSQNSAAALEMANISRHLHEGN